MVPSSSGSHLQKHYVSLFIEAKTLQVLAGGIVGAVQSHTKWGLSSMAPVRPTGVAVSARSCRGLGPWLNGVGNRAWSVGGTVPWHSISEMEANLLGCQLEGKEERDLRNFPVCSSFFERLGRF